MLIAVGLPIFGALFVVAPQAFPLIFGSNWYEAGVYARLLAPYLLLSIVAQPLSTLLTVKEWQQALLVFTVFELALRMGAIYWGIAIQQMYWAVFLFASSSAPGGRNIAGLIFPRGRGALGRFWARSTQVHLAQPARFVAAVGAHPLGCGLEPVGANGIS